MDTRMFDGTRARKHICVASAHGATQSSSGAGTWQCAYERLKARKREGTQVHKPTRIDVCTKTRKSARAE
eukprot:12747311-Alexandrium_andersonii.AAC.1